MNDDVIDGPAHAADATFMALALAEAAKGTPSPNPHVGAVIVSQQSGSAAVIGRGYCARSGEAHAEVAAIRAASAHDGLAGSTMYVTLEPHDHHGRTPPCTDAIIAAGIKRVVVGVIDPNPRVLGRGIRHLRDAGLEVVVGVRGAECAAIVAPFGKHCTTGMPFARVKIASSLDGRIAAAALGVDQKYGASKWITGPEARARVHAMRARADAIVTGVGTVEADDPSLTVREAAPIEGRNAPVRVVLDTHARTPIEATLVKTARDVATWIVVGSDAARDRVSALEAAGVRVLRCAIGSGASIDPRAAMTLLGREGIVDLLVEAGGHVVGALVAADLIDEIHLFLAPIVLGSSGASSVIGPTPTSPRDAPRWATSAVERVGDDVLVTMSKAK